VTGPIGPRLIVAGTHSNVGKTTVTTGLLAVLTRRGFDVAGAKVGPDFIDPGYHSLASGRPPRNLDAWMCGPEAIRPLAGRATSGADLLIIEGVMGLFDGAVDGTPSSTADVARLLDAPVILVVDGSSLSSSVAALVHGYASYRPEIQVAGVILNRVGSAVHEALLREALADQPVQILGALPRDPRFVWRDRHLGLVPVIEEATAVSTSLEALAAAVSEHVDLEGVVRLARSAPTLRVDPPVLPSPQGRSRVAMAAGAAFSFAYTDTVEALAAADAEVVPFDPLRDDRLPDDVDGLLIGGGFPEEYAARLSSNLGLMEDLRAKVAQGVPTWAECGGLLLLCRSLDGHAMAGVVPAEAEMTGRLTLGYRTATLEQDCLVGSAGAQIRGHEFHYSRVTPAGDGLSLGSRFSTRAEGWAGADLLATYLHHHPGGDPGPVGRFAARAAQFRRQRSARPGPSRLGAG